MTIRADYLPPNLTSLPVVFGARPTRLAGAVTEPFVPSARDHILVVGARATGGFFGASTACA